MYMLCRILTFDERLRFYVLSGPPWLINELFQTWDAAEYPIKVQRRYNPA